ncbi:MAG: lasso peptide isopeptide bond-forming cyclase [Candidatus Sulfopaludibacter sp.]|nr:lasso peptide isopeptide bond-forming cyclase [Candidatus Sulfopaludibacter sp.]
MSGICGKFIRDGEGAASGQVQAMNARMIHRGPDAQATWVDGPVALGHCMLRITPESLQERQPLVSQAGDYAITADARLDNREELMDDLWRHDPSGQPADPELILAAYRQWGEDCPRRILGDFAFVIWDRPARRLFCACDPMGVKGFYYHLCAKAFSFASEIKALFALPEVPRRLNELRVAEYLVTLFEDRAGTFYQEIFRLPGAHTLTVTAAKTELREYWSLDSRSELRLGSDGEYAEAFKDLFSKAVRCRTRSAYPVGAALSGGLDSSSVACAAARMIPECAGPLRTFSLIFPSLPEKDLRRIDERPQMQAVLESGNFAPHFIEADRLSPLWQVDRMHYHLDHANYAPNLYLHWAMYDAARKQGVRVFLDGFDGDSTVSHGFERLTELAQTLRWVTLWRETRLLSQHHLAGIAPRRILNEYCVKPLSPAWVYRLRTFLRTRGRALRRGYIFINPEFKARTRIEDRARRLLHNQTRWTLTRTARETHCMGLNQALYSYTLEIADKASAAFEIEARYPFFDRRLMEFCVALPAEQKLGNGWNRYIQRRAMSGILPPGIQWRARKGNLSPNFYLRLLDFERERLEEISLRGMAELAPFIDADAVRAAYTAYRNSHSQGQGEGIQLFATLNLALWLRSAGFAS